MVSEDLKGWGKAMGKRGFPPPQGAVSVGMAAQARKGPSPARVGLPPPPTQFGPPAVVNPKMAPSAPHKAKLSSPVVRGAVVQPMMSLFNPPTRARQLYDFFVGQGSYMQLGTDYNLSSGARSEISWISENILNAAGVPYRPTNAVCPKCNQTRTSFELDHMNPWRQYVASMLGPNEYQVQNGAIHADKALVRSLYNDPQNLWWICRSCNRAKTDYIIGDGKSFSDFNKGSYSGPKGRNTGFVMFK